MQKIHLQCKPATYSTTYSAPENPTQSTKVMPILKHEPACESQCGGSIEAIDDL